MTCDCSRSPATPQHLISWLSQRDETWQDRHKQPPHPTPPPKHTQTQAYAHTNHKPFLCSLLRYWPLCYPTSLLHHVFLVVHKVSSFYWQSLFKPSSFLPLPPPVSHQVNILKVNQCKYWTLLGKTVLLWPLKKKKKFDFLLFFLLHCFLSVVLFFFPSICPPSFLAFLYVVLYVPASVCPLTHRTDPGEICHVEIRWVWSKVQFDPTDTRAHINRLQPPTTDICPFVTTQLDRG